MNKTFKSASKILAVVGISVLASAGTVFALQRGDGFSSQDTYISQGGESSAEAYGFHNTSMPMTSSRTVGSAPDLVPAAEASVRAVVHIKVEAMRQSGGGQMIDPFEFFFGGGARPQQSEPVVGYGSGVIISNDGYIMTNNHVIDGGKTISVTLNDNRTFTATLVGTDPSTDIALLKIDAKDLPTLPFGDSDKLRLGEWVLAVGNPMNLTGTVTAGIVSAKGRNTSRIAPGGNKIEAFIQTDAAVNGGNSGGALVNTAGELVGINTMIYSKTGSYSGYSFAVPINMAAKVVEDIKKFGSVQRAIIGIAGTDVDADLVKKEGLKVNRGVYVAEFSEVSAALAAGLEKGDVITAINDHPIDDFGKLQEQISRYRPGDVVSIRVNRKGENKTFKVTLRNQEGGRGMIKDDLQKQSSKLGATLRALDAQTLRSYGLSYGVEVQKLGSGSLKNAGVRQGFIILNVEDRPVRSVEDINKLVGAAASSRGSVSLIFRGFYPETGDIVSYRVEVK